MRLPFEQARGVDVESGLRAGPAVPADGLVRQRLRHRGGQTVELVLRLHQHVVAHVEIGGDLAGPDRLVGDQIDACCRSPTPASACRALLLVGSASHCVAARDRALRRERQLRGLAPTSWTPELVKMLTWLLVVRRRPGCPSTAES